MPTLEIDGNWRIPPGELRFHYARSGGPGGQNVNKVETKAELRFDYATSSALTSGQKLRLRRNFPAHVTSSGEFVVVSDQHRSRRQNEREALTRLAAMLKAVRYPPKPRIPTKVTLSQKRRRVEHKRRRGMLKRSRGSGADD